jgi:spore coat polysaccharide biosynthesis protein SpsF
LQKADTESRDSFEREHVTQYFYRHPEIFPQANLRNEQDLSYLRWTIDTLLDYEMAKTVYSALYTSGRVFLFDEIMSLIKENPEIALINSQVPRSAMYSQTTKKV